MLHSLVFALALVAQAPAGDYDFRANAVENEIVTRTNACRGSQGLPYLQVDYGLMRTARQQSAAMASRGIMQHSLVRNDVAENIAMGQRSAEDAVRDWWNSSGHRRNMLGGYRYVGVAAYVDGRGTVYWTQQFR